MWPYVVAGFKMIGVTDQPKHFKSPVIKAEQSADSYIINSTLLSSIERGKAIIEIHLLATQVIEFISLLVVGFLKNLVGSDAGCFDSFKSFDLKWSCIYVYPTDFTISFFYAINYLYRMGNKFRGIFFVLSVNQNESLLTGFFERFYFTNQTLVR